MASLFIANGSYQTYHFLYRVPEQPTLRRLEIPAGCQRAVPSNDTEGHSLEFILQQLKRVGAVEASESHHISMPRSLIYTVDRKSIDSDTINEARERDEEARQNISAIETEKAGLALLQVAEEFADRNRGTGRVTSTKLDVTEVNDEGPILKDAVDVEISASRNYPDEPRRGKKRS